MDNISIRQNELFKKIEIFPENRLYWIEKVIDILNCPREFILYKNKTMNKEWFMTFGDALMIHHAFSNEPFTKDKFEHALVNTAKIIGLQAEFEPKGNRGPDVMIGSLKYSLKTQADIGIKPDLIWISKYMELGKGEWTDKQSQLIELTKSFLKHLAKSDKILMLRCLSRGPKWKYELIEIPKKLLERCKKGEYEMKMNSTQTPKPGYCYVKDKNGEDFFRLYFDGGSERKLQIQNLKKDNCIIIGEWNFEPEILLKDF